MQVNETSHDWISKVWWVRVSERSRVVTDPCAYMEVLPGTVATSRGISPGLIVLDKL